MEDNTKAIGLTAHQVDVTSAEDIDPDTLAYGLELVEQEKVTSIKSVLASHYKAAAWGVMLSFALVMEGFDMNVVNSFYGQPAFQRKFGDLQPDGSYNVSAKWQSAIGNMASVGTLIGLIITGYCQEAFGARKTYAVGMLAMIATIFLAVFAQNLPMLLAAELLMGIPWGMFQTLSTAYAAEICPIRLRGLLASFVNMAWGIGIFLSSGVTRATLKIDSNWAWRLPYALQWVWPVPLFVGALLIPESPWWLVRKGRIDDAKRALERLARPGYYDERKLDAYVAVMKHTDDLDRAEAAKGSYKECFQGTNLRRTEIMFGVWLCQIWDGQYITSYGVVFFEAAGLAAETAFDINLSLNSMFIIGTMVGWCLIPHFGRRTLYLAGMLLQALLLLITGILGVVPSRPGITYGIGAILILINFVYNVTIGPLCYTISGELPSSRLRTRSIAMGRFVYSACSIAVGQLNPHMMNQTAWNWGAKSGWFWLGTNALCTLWCFFRLPETGKFSFAELDILFANKVPARHFTKVKIDDAAGHGAIHPAEGKLEVSHSD
ncbi:Maltose permease MAL61 [Vanrija pseudolonga]|uniref:Maltose permease MAL61 n=1 Tax=Vanrija pseudolonga TaxID=143232 RepID=A0AAF0YC76_9TREE|nr:Maltose permease MAL61 [Vanrija pseudolonga]